LLSRARVTAYPRAPTVTDTETDDLLVVTLVSDERLPVLLALLRPPRPGWPAHPSALALLYTGDKAAEMNDLVAVLRRRGALDADHMEAIYPEAAGYAAAHDEHALGIPPLTLTVRRVAPFDPVAAEQAALAVIGAFPGRFVRVDITPGTKMMALGAYRAAVRATHRLQRSVEVQYVSTQEEVYCWTDPGSEEHTWERSPFPATFAGLRAGTLLTVQRHRLQPARATKDYGRAP
jgi:hypothetical protein